MLDQVIVPALDDSEGYTLADMSALELTSRRKAQGAVYRKHILTMGRLIHPQTGENIQIDQSFVDSLKRNFDNQVCDSVAVPLADSQNRHSEDPLRNLGEVIGVEQQGKNVYALMDIRRPDAAAQMGKTLLGASAFLSLNYRDTRTGDKVGPALLHTCVTNRPYLTDLQPYEEVIAATADGMGDDAVVLTPEETAMPELSKDELIAALKGHGIDVEALQAMAGDRSQFSAMAEQLSDALALSGQPMPAGDELTLSDITGAIAELAQLTQGLQEENILLARERAATEVDSLIAQGRVLPSQREGILELALTNRELMAQLVPDKPVVNLELSRGYDTGSADASGNVTDVDQEIIRLTEAHGKFFPHASK